MTPQSLEFSTIHISPPPPKNKTKQKNFVFSEKDQGKILFCQWENSLKVDNSWIIQKNTFYNWKKLRSFTFTLSFYEKKENFHVR